MRKYVYLVHPLLPDNIEVVISKPEAIVTSKKIAKETKDLLEEKFNIMYTVDRYSTITMLLN